MKKFFKNIFSKKKADNEKDNNVILLQKIQNSINKCLKDKNSALDDIENIKKWSKELILEIFKVPSAYWYEELKEYENIKYLPENQNVSQRLVHKCDEVIKGYREQITVQETKIKLSDTLLIEYGKTNKKLQDTILKISKLKKEEEQMKLLEKHNKRISEMSNNTADLENAYNYSDNLEFMNIDIQTIEDEFKLHEEFLNQMELIGSISKSDLSDLFR